MAVTTRIIGDINWEKPGKAIGHLRVPRSHGNSAWGTVAFGRAFGAPYHIMSREVDGSGTFQPTSAAQGWIEAGDATVVEISEYDGN